MSTRSQKNMSKVQKIFKSSVNFNIPFSKFIIIVHQKPLNHFSIFINLITYKQSPHSTLQDTPKVLELSKNFSLFSLIQLVLTSYSFLLPLFSVPSKKSIRKSPFGILPLRLSLYFILFYLFRFYILKKMKKY